MIRQTSSYGWPNVKKCVKKWQNRHFYDLLTNISSNKVLARALKSLQTTLMRWGCIHTQRTKKGILQIVSSYLIGILMIKIKDKPWKGSGGRMQLNQQVHILAIYHYRANRCKMSQTGYHQIEILRKVRKLRQLYLALYSSNYLMIRNIL